MSTDTSYREWLKQDYGKLIDALQLDDMQKHFMRSRWLDQVLWMESKCEKNQRWYYILRLVAIVGGVIVPALVSLKLGDGKVSSLISWLTFGISLMVAISVAVEEFFHFGERWRHYRRTVELLKIEGWRFFQLGEPYQQSATHGAAYPLFAGKVEEIMQSEVDVFISKVVQAKKEKENQEAG
ncbi:MAG: DUF4231 domain-containing protein [Proteobacteria bacterium]|nr:DUF4231 domain-containing protein [Pseudomonadota bacterium]MBU4297195.1 DUF4231 domain-containing protein [Pseudomonadota bacterium]MCG2750088.1 DUF4231 domain-containing protein [Desulfobulbaceae bacterium]